MTNKTITRRTFITVSSLFAAGCAVSAPKARHSRRISLNEKLNLAFVGAGGRGDGNLGMAEKENAVAICDVDFAMAARGFKRFPDAQKFYDYRRMFDKLHRQIDAVVVSTPDHMHAPISLAAMQMGKHVYCEKPLTRAIGEARRLSECASRYQLVTQMGNGGNASRSARATVELIRAKPVGRIREVHAWTDRPGNIWKQGLERPTENQSIPETLDWDLWLGVAPERPYHKTYHPGAWRGWWDFGTGAMGDMACHICNVAFWGLDLRDPVSAEATYSGLYKESFPEWCEIVYEFPARGDREALKFYWYDGGHKPSPDLVYGRNVPGNGVIIVGEKGVIFIPSSDGKDAVLLPEKDFEGYVRPPQSLPDSPGHHEEFVAACKEGRMPGEWMSHFGRASLMTEALLVGNLAVHLGQRVEWDAVNMKVTNIPEAEPLVHPVYRKGWEI